MKKKPKKHEMQISTHAGNLLLSGGTFLLTALATAIVIYLFIGTVPAIKTADTLLTLGLKGSVIATAAAMIYDITYLKNKEK